jgi:hypothetical protein
MLKKGSKTILIKLIAFFLVFNLLFFSIRFFNLLPPVKLIENNSSLPWLFSAIELIFSIISGFIIQSKWSTWNTLIDATHEELSSVRELYILSHHFSKEIRQQIKEKISNYLSLILEESETNKNLSNRSAEVDQAIFQLEETIFSIDYAEHPNIGSMAFDLVRKCMESREKRLQNILHSLPLGVKVFIIFATYSSIFTSLFIGVTSIGYDYLFTSVIALLAYGIYLLIDDLDHPYRPGQWHLSMKGYREVLREINEDKWQG